MNAEQTSLMDTSFPTPSINPKSKVLPEGSQQNLQNTSAQKPFINIVEQPATKALRFRYKCEGRSAGSIPGVNSTPENKTYPTIEIVGYEGDVVIVASCVTKDPPYRQHPHYLVGKDGCKDGICTLVLTGETRRAVFSNLGVQCVKKSEIKSALEVRERLQVDPFRTRFGHKDQPSSIDLNVVRLCFQAFLKTESGVKPLQPVVSEPIHDKKAILDLVIYRLCCCSAKVGGGDEIILLCEKIAKDDIKFIKIRFYELSNDNQLIWEDYAEFQPTDIHKQTAIAFKTPRYYNQDVSEKSKVFIQLVRSSDGVQSKPLPFEYYSDPDEMRRKRLKTGGHLMNILRTESQKYGNRQPYHFQNDIEDTSNMKNNNFWNIPTLPVAKVKPESVRDNANLQNMSHFRNLMMPVIQQQQSHQQDQQQQQSQVYEDNKQHQRQQQYQYQHNNEYQQQQQHHHQQHQHQHQHQPSQSTMNFLPNVSGEEGTTLSGLLAFVDGENFVNVTSDNLRLSNLSITT